MIFKRFIILSLFFYGSISAQSFLFQNEFGKFKSATSFSITPGGFFFVADDDNNEVQKIDTLGNVIQSIGGYGWEISTFDEPADIFATDLRIYVTDKNNNRIQVFDKDLNYLFVIKTENQYSDLHSFQYPTSCVTSTQGDIYILDSDNSRVMKFNSEGNFLLEFGNFDSADFVLSSPLKLAVSHDSKLFVIEDNRLLAFDQFGMGLLKINSDKKIKNINITFNNLVVNNSDSLYYLNLSNKENRVTNITPQNLDKEYTIVEGLVFNNNLFVLTKSSILQFRILYEN